MVNSQLLFLFGCIPTRILLAYISTKIPENYLPLFGAILLAMGLGFLYLYFTNKRMDAPEAGGKTWWGKYRIIHGMFYLTAAIYAFQKKPDLIWIPLTLDVIFGLCLFVLHHFF